MNGTVTLEHLEEVRRRSDCLHDAAAVRGAVADMAGAINAAMEPKVDTLVMPIMNGGLVPAGWLLPLFDFPFELDYLHASRYRGETQGGQLQWLKPPAVGLEGRELLLIDDILDEGVTLKLIVEACRQQGAASVRTAVLARKDHDRNVGFEADFVGLEVEDRYVFGCGMDYRNHFRQLPAIHALPDDML
ncbi:MAG: hypoxanthine-guanine phosphoribosyltransferase [Gammaproteobacteria bacterium]|nr:hypoxanthine-guanine phosphoribosyltransferase [Gammaproteobacteria bacterium]